MTIFHYLISFVILVIFTGTLRFLQLQNRIWVDLYVFVFAPLGILAVACLLFALADVKAIVFLDIGRFLIIHSILGLILGYVWQLVMKRY